MKITLGTLALLAGMLLILGFFGHIHPILDAIAIGRYVALLALLACMTLLLFLSRRYILSLTVFVALLASTAVLHIPGDGEVGPIRVYTKNLWHGNTRVAELAADIKAADPDIVILQEVSENNIGLMAELQADLPFQARCPWQGWNGIAILSRWPLVDSTVRCSSERSLMAVQVQRREGAFWAVGIHLQQPWPDVQWEHLERALLVLSKVRGRAIVAGDFNTVPWSAAAKRIGQITNTTAVPPGRITFRLWGVGLPLDQVWALGGKAQRRPLVGSDHHGVVADVWPSRFR